jgi:hypothetical protein
MIVGMMSLEAFGLKINAMEMALLTTYIQVYHCVLGLGLGARARVRVRRWRLGIRGLGFWVRGQG